MYKINITIAIKIVAAVIQNHGITVVSSSDADGFGVDVGVGIDSDVKAGIVDMADTVSSSANRAKTVK